MRRWLLAVLGLALLAAVLQAHAATAAPMEVGFAEATLEPDGLPPQVRRVPLPFRWDHEFPGRGGKASYRMELPDAAVPAGAPSALLMTGVGNQVAVYFNDALVASYGTLGDPGYEASKGNHLVHVAAALHREGRPQVLEVRTTIQRQRGAGLATVQYGTEAALTPI